MISCIALSTTFTVRPFDSMLWLRLWIKVSRCQDVTPWNGAEQLFKPRRRWGVHSEHWWLVTGLDFVWAVNSLQITSIMSSS
jgi:hypothetical protein